MCKQEEESKEMEVQVLINCSTRVDRTDVSSNNKLETVLNIPTLRNRIKL